MKYRASYKKFMGIPMNLENENLKLILGDAEQLIETTSNKNDLKTSQRFNKKNLSNTTP
jgi:regulator of replication initiation timing